MPNRPASAALSPERLASAARTCPVLVGAQALAQWIGAGRQVTARGVLRPAAAVEACFALGIAAPSRKPRSALDIDELMMVWSAASAAGFIEVSGGRVTTGPGLQAWLDGDPETALACWRASALESLGLARETDEEDLDYLAVLVTLHERGGAAALEDLSAGVTELLTGAPSGCTCPDCAPQPGGPEGTAGLVRYLVDAADIEDPVEALGEFGIATLRDDVARLTPLGHWLTDFMFRESAPPADADAVTLARELAEFPGMVSALMARPWLSARTPAEAVRELLAAGETTSGQERLTAVVLARECGPESAPAWQEWAAKDGFGAYARVWLAEQDGTEAREADEAWITVDTLATMLDALPPDIPADLLPTVVLVEAGDEMAQAVPLLEGSDHPDASRIATLLGCGAGSPAGSLAGTSPGAGGSVQRPALRLVTADERDEGDEGDAGPVPSPRQGRPGAAYQLKIQLRDVTKPPVWRRVQVPADLGLDRFHEIIQAAMGWENGHLHRFSSRRGDYGIPDPELGHRDERRVRLSQLLAGAGDRIGYTYDFGDGWKHDIVLETILPADAGVTGPVCTAGTGACPPEDCGGAWGYEALKATLADPKSEEYEDMLGWLGLKSGEEFDPEEFSVTEVNRRFGECGLTG